MYKSNETRSVCLHPSSTHHLSSGPLNLQLVGETPAVAFNWVGDVTKLSSGLSVCTRAHAYVCVWKMREWVCVEDSVCVHCSAQDARRIRGFRWVDRTFASESKRFGNVDCVCTSRLLKKKLEVLESESALVENVCKTFFYVLFVRWSSFSHDVNTGLFKAVSRNVTDGICKDGMRSSRFLL